MERSKADSFTAYLEAKQRSKSSDQTPSGGTPLALLNALANAEKQQVPVTELMAASGIPLPDFADALKNLLESGYLTLSGPPSAQIAALTKLGEDVSRLARPT